MPTLQTVRNTPSTLYIFDNAERHPRIRSLIKERNVTLLRTCSDAGVAYHDQYYKYNIGLIAEDVQRIKDLLLLLPGYMNGANAQQSLSLERSFHSIMFPESGIGVASRLLIYAPRTRMFLYTSLRQLLTVTCNKYYSDIFAQQTATQLQRKWREWGLKCTQEEEHATRFNFDPGLYELLQRRKLHNNKVKNAWFVSFHIQYLKKKKDIKNAKLKNEQWIDEQKRRLHHEQMKNRYLIQRKTTQIETANRLLKEQKRVERQYLEKEQDLQMQLQLLQLQTKQEKLHSGKDIMHAQKLHQNRNQLVHEYVDELRNDVNANRDHSSSSSNGAGIFDSIVIDLDLDVHDLSKDKERVAKANNTNKDFNARMQRMSGELKGIQSTSTISAELVKPQKKHQKKSNKTVFTDFLRYPKPNT